MNPARRASDREGAHLLDPPLPFEMRPRIERALADARLQAFVNGATLERDRGRVRVCQEAFGADLEALRELAGQVKQHTLDHLDVYLEQFIDQATAAGAHVHLAADANEANEIALSLARASGCKLCVKSKSMVTEEIGLLPRLQEIGVETIETDLGEFIIQLDKDAPSHIVTPMIHKDRSAVARAFQRELGAPYTEDPEELTRIARRYLRAKYREAGLGISGANFLVAETGTLVLCTNEGNGSFCVSGPRLHVAFAGIEKVIPRLEHLSLFLKLLARSATAQAITVYTTMITGPRRAADHDGPKALHIVLADNGRTHLLRGESRELLRCIRCGACLNACPVYRKVGGGHAYGAVYSGPIGAAITPLFKGLANYRDLPQASSLCGACAEACPVKIDLPRHLVRLRQRAVEGHLTGFFERCVFRLWRIVLERSRLYRVATAMQRVFLRAIGARAGGKPPHGDGRWVWRAPGLLRGWTSQRDLLSPPSRGFRDWWRERAKEDKP
ncbi:MAG: lactate utilization protein B [Planctomycetota bacterium]